MSDYMTTSHQLVTAFFDTRAQAEAAVERILAAGIQTSQVRLVEGRADADGSPGEPKGFFEALADFFMPDDDRHAYAEGLNRGGYVVSANVDASERDRILDILDDEGTVDMDDREQSWRDEGWAPPSAGYSGAADRPYDQTDGVMDSGSDYPATRRDEEADYPAARKDADEDGSVDIVEEQFRVGKRDVDHGRVRVRTYVVETPVEADVSLRHERVRLERRPVDRAASDDAFADRSIEATERGEEAVVSKEARVVEEISLAKDVEERSETVRDSVRRTEVDIEDDRSDELPLRR